MMKISVALCTYNGSVFLGEQLASIAAQMRLPDELVVCDDGSTDTTVEIVRQFAARAGFPVRLFINETNLRSTKNFEKAISLCEGDIIALCDQDDVWHADKLKIFAAIFAAKPNVGLVFCNANLVDENLQPLNSSNWDLLDFNEAKQRDFVAGKGFEYMLKGAFVWGCMMAFRARYKSLVLPIPENLPDIIHDSWAAIMIAAVASVEPIPQCLVDYRQHPAQQLGHRAGDEIDLIETIGKKYDYDEEIVRLDGFLNRLRSADAQFAAEKAVKIADARRHHFLNRRKMKNGGAATKLRLVARELFSRRYHRHTSGLKSAAKDLLTG